ncbi:unnamed protein product [Merluccius merluccius]
MADIDRIMERTTRRRFLFVRRRVTQSGEGSRRCVAPGNCSASLLANSTCDCELFTTAEYIGSSPPDHQSPDQTASESEALRRDLTGDQKREEELRWDGGGCTPPPASSAYANMDPGPQGALCVR